MTERASEEDAVFNQWLVELVKVFAEKHELPLDDAQEYVWENYTEWRLYFQDGHTPAGSVLSYQRKSGAAVKNHPTEKPVALLRELIESSSRIGDVVFDPFMGSGSAGVAALLEGRGFVGIELDKGYFEISKHRLTMVWDAMRTISAAA